MKGTFLVVVLVLMAIAPVTSFADEPAGEVSSQDVSVKGEDPADESKTNAGKVEKIGEKYDVEQALKEAILKAEKVLLGRSKWEVSVGLSFSTDEDDVLAFREGDEGVVIGLEEQTQYALAMNTRLDYGITDDLEAYVNLPLVYKERERTFEGSSDSDSATGLGDISVGLKYQIKRETATWPDIMLSLDVLTPSGEDPYEISANDVPLGNGHWETGFGVSVVKSSDPAVLFGGLGYSHSFSRDVKGNKIEPGYDINFNFGAVFAMNNQLSLMFQTAGSYSPAVEVDGHSVGSSSVPILFETGLTYVISKTMYVDMDVGLGMTDDASDSVIGLSLSRRF